MHHLPPLRAYVPTCLRAFLLTLTLAACQSTPPTYDDPVAVMLDRDAYPEQRQAAAAQAEVELADAPARLAALEKLLTEPGHGHRWQIYALDQLAAVAPDHARALLAEHLPAFSSWDTARRALDLAVEHDWRDLLPAMVRRYAIESRRFADADRPERAAIAALAPDRPVEEVVRDVFASPRHDVRERAAAFALLVRLLDDRDRLLAWLEELDAADDPLIADIQAAAAELHIVPTNMETLTWLRLLRTPLGGNVWPGSAAVIAELSADQREGLAPRHLPVLVHVARTEPAVLERSAAELYAELADRLAAADTHPIESRVDALADHPQELAAWRDHLAFADLLTIRLITRMMDDPAIVQQWFTQADADLADGTTEYGGLVVVDADGKVVPRLYEPALRRHANAYYPPPQLIFDGYTALAHYHFHAQRYDNRRVAGPGEGDLRRIGGRQQFNGIVLTFIDRDRLNVDYYQAGRVVIDLGAVYR